MVPLDVLTKFSIDHYVLSQNCIFLFQLWDMICCLRGSFVEAGIFDGKYMYSSLVTGHTQEVGIMAEVDTETNML